MQDTSPGEFNVELKDDKLKNAAQTETQQEYFSVKELSEYSRIGTKHLYYLIQMASFPYLKIGSKIVVRRSDFDAFFDSKKNTDALIPKIRIQGRSEKFESKSQGN